MRFILRLLSMLALAVAVIMAVVDATRTIAAAAWAFTSLSESWRATWPDMFDGVRAAVSEYAPLLWDPVLTAILSLPGWVVFAALAFVFHAAAHWRRRHGAYTSIAR